jgi:hypothetical protein
VSGYGITATFEKKATASKSTTTHSRRWQGLSCWLIKTLTDCLKQEKGLDFNPFLYNKKRAEGFLGKRNGSNHKRS